MARLLLCTALAASVALADLAPPPFTYSLDQAVPCPRDVNNAWYSQHEGAAKPVGANASAALAAAVAGVPAALEKYLQALKAPSVGLIAVQNGQVLSEGYAGVAKVGGSAPPTRSSRYAIASNTKVFTSAMMFQLRDRGLLPKGLDTEVREILPGWREPQRPAAWRSRRGLTLRALATHSAGLVREVPSGYPADEPGQLDAIGNSSLLFPQFASTHYSNLGVALLGRALEKAAGKSWERWVEEELLQPLGMKDSGPCVRSSEEADALIDGVDPSTGKKVHVKPTRSESCAWSAPCGDMFSSNGDMATWVALLTGQIERPEILDPDTVREMRNTLMLQPDGLSGVGAATFEAAFSHGRWTFNKLGCDDGYRSDTTLVPELGLGLVAFAASTCDLFGDGDAVAFPVVSELIPALEEVLAERLDRSAGDVPGADAFVGRYCSRDAASAMEVSLGKGGGLRVTNGPQGDQQAGMGYAWRLLPVDGSPDTFRMLMVGSADDEEFLPAEWPGCRDAAGPWPDANLCPVSCFRQMSRGDAELMVFIRDSAGRVAGVRVPGTGDSCSKDGGRAETVI